MCAPSHELAATLLGRTRPQPDSSHADSTGSLQRHAAKLSHKVRLQDVHEIAEWSTDQFELAQRGTDLQRLSLNGKLPWVLPKQKNGQSSILASCGRWLGRHGLPGKLLEPLHRTCAASVLSATPVPFPRAPPDACARGPRSPPTASRPGRDSRSGAHSRRPQR